MMNDNRLATALFILSVPIAYLGVWVSADITAHFKNVSYDIPLGRVALSASLLFIITLAFSQILKGRHISILRIICAGLITVIAAYLALVFIEALYWSSTMQNDVSATFRSIFGVRLGVYLGRFIPVSLCLSIIALIISRNLILKNQTDAVNETF